MEMFSATPKLVEKILPYLDLVSNVSLVKAGDVRIKSDSKTEIIVNIGTEIMYWPSYKIKHRKNCECYPGYYLIVNRNSSMS